MEEYYNKDNSAIRETDVLLVGSVGATPHQGRDMQGGY